MDFLINATAGYFGRRESWLGGSFIYDVTSLEELLVDFAYRSVDAFGYPAMAANPGGIFGIPAKKTVLQRMV